jgi:hypothetical protein
MRRPKRNLFLAIVLAVLAAAANADPAPPLPADTAIVPADTTGQSPVADTTVVSRDSLAVDSVILEPVLYQRSGDTVLIETFARTTVDTLRRTSPTVTMFKSVVFPGWGQWSNRKYLKAGIVFAVESYFLYKYIHYARKASDWRDRWQAVPDTSTAEQSAAFKQYADYRDSRNSNLWGVVVTVFLSMFDAYVDAHLRDFPPPVAGQTTVSWNAEPGNGASLALTYHF